MCTKSLKFPAIVKKVSTSAIRFDKPSTRTILGHLAQLVEQLTLNQRVIGSNPIVPTILVHLILWK